MAYMSTQRSSCSQFGDETTITTLSVTKESTQIAISSLDPSLEYCVATAASTVAGISDFSFAQKVSRKCMANHLVKMLG